MGKKVAVLGAGFAGLAAARDLAGEFDVAVYEASNRLGGRVHTNRTLVPGFPIELGGNLIHDLNSALGKLVVEIGVPTVKWPKTSEMRFRTDRNEFLSYPEARRNDPDLEGARAWKIDLRKTPVKAGESLDTFLARIGYSGRARAFVQRGFGNACGLSIKELDAEQALREIGAYAGVDRLVRGFDVVIDHLAKGLKINTGCEVVNVDWSAKRTATITFKHGSVETADAVIVTFPLGVLKKNKDLFTPGLDSNRLVAMEYGEMTPNGKLIYVVPSPVFEKGKFPKSPMAFSSDDKPSTWWMQNYGKNVRLNGKSVEVWCGFFGGPGGRELIAMPSEKALAYGLATLRKETGISNLEPMEQVMTTWHKESLAGDGAYSAWRPGGAYAREVISRPMECVFWGGEGTVRGDGLANVSATHAAFDSGLRTARETRGFLRGVPLVTAHC